MQNYLIKAQKNRHPREDGGSFVKGSLLSEFCYSHVGEEDEVHHEGIDDGRDGDDLVVEDKWTACDGDGLCGILHAYFDDQGATFFGGQAE